MTFRKARHSVHAVTNKIFISYRRADSTFFAHLLHNRLEQEFGTDSVFIDVDSIGAGIDFVEAITKAIAESVVVLVLIGWNWEPGGLHDPGDFVRLELMAALERGSRIIPILLEGTAMPRSEELPADLSRFVRLNAVEIRSDRLKSDMHLLFEELKRIVPKGSPEPSATPKPNVSEVGADVPSTTASNPNSFAYRLGNWLSLVRPGRRVLALLWLIAVSGFLQVFPLMVEVENPPGFLLVLPVLGFFLTLVALGLTVLSFRGTSRSLLLSGLVHVGAVTGSAAASNELTILTFFLLCVVPCANFALSFFYNKRATRGETYQQTGW
ncbi:MAG TPA: toll/interleukin-1 receptor domain-containing protein [Thermoanaerobaculia bacterium]|nr:toll/interleukin-1 receptor domain-containing protein [Thermoanaerobaculia bacterium]